MLSDTLRRRTCSDPRALAALLALCAACGFCSPAAAQQSMVADWDPLAAVKPIRRLPPLDPPAAPLPAPAPAEQTDPSPSDAPPAAAQSNGQPADEAPPEEVETPPPADAEPLQAAEVIEEVEVEPPPSPWEAWNGSVSLGLSGTEGNTETLSMRVAAKAKHETPHNRHAFELTHVDKSNQGNKTALSTLLDARVEWLFPDSPWSYYMHGSNEYDQFRAFDVRVQADTGVGFEFKNDVQSLISRFGGSFSREVGGPDDRYVPELSFSTEWKYKLNDRNKCMIKTEYYPDVTSFQEFRLNGRAEWETVVEPEWGLSLKLSVVDRFDSTPNGARDNDLDYAVLLMWSF